VEADECTADHRYRTATIRLDAAQHDSEAELLRTMRHELLHLLHVDFNLYWMCAMRGVSGRAKAMMGEVYEAAQEKTVAAIEAMLDSGLGMNAGKMVRVARRLRK